jgi:hypothetical protein
MAPYGATLWTKHAAGVLPSWTNKTNDTSARKQVKVIRRILELAEQRRQCWRLVWPQWCQPCQGPKRDVLTFCSLRRAGLVQWWELSHCVTGLRVRSSLSADFAGGRLASVFLFPRPHSCGSLRHWAGHFLTFCSLCLIHGDTYILSAT